jgi:hypothetical protein
MVLPPGKDDPMPRPKPQSLTIATVRCLLALCVFGLFIGPEVLAQRASQRMSMDRAKHSQVTGSISGRNGVKVSFGIKGRVRGLYPGARKRLRARLNNPNNFAIRVRSLRVEVLSSNHAGCVRRAIRPKRSITLSVRVPPKGRFLVFYPVRMRRTAPEACSGATWRLRFTGRGARP